MSQDDRDDPFSGQGDKTLLRTRPGAGRRGTSPPAGDAPVDLGLRRPDAAGHSVEDGPRSSEWVDELLRTGLNPLVQAAAPLLILAGRLRGQLTHPDVAALRRQTNQEMRAFENRANQAGVPPEDVLAARYALCTVVDEAVMATPWGAQSDWPGESLLATFHREVFGGEKFFQIMDRVSSQGRRYLSLLELLYVCLALGFEGQYRLMDRGAEKLAAIRTDLYRRIRALRGAPESDLSPHWRGIEDRRNAALKFVPLWVVGAACIVLLMGAWLMFNGFLGTRAEPVNAALVKLGSDAADATPGGIAAGASAGRDGTAQAARVAPSGLRRTLAPEIGQGLIELDETGPRTAITLVSTDLFNSGSAEVNPRYGTELRSIGAALERYPGRISVIGHTDSRPIHSFQYADNYELSRDRAQHVARLLRAQLSNPARVEATGAGPSRPKYLPADDPTNQARNRRVEIMLRRDQ